MFYLSSKFLANSREIKSSNPLNALVLWSHAVLCGGKEIHTYKAFAPSMAYDLDVCLTKEVTVNPMQNSPDRFTKDDTAESGFSGANRTANAL
jgi:DNA primase